MQTDVPSAKQDDSAARRSFMVRLSAIASGAIVTLFPFAVGWGVFTDPVRRRKSADGSDDAESLTYSRVCPLDALPADGTPRQFAVVADVTDAWTHAPDQRIGSVFLIRDVKDANKLTCFTATCPHLGCTVEFSAANNQFECPCHKSGFAKDGEKLFGPSRRGLDPLPVKLEDKAGTKTILVAYERFQGGIPERKPIE
jgi:quinol---cytochrome c reductase iron-sulfur subunit, bacillus type